MAVEIKEIVVKAIISSNQLDKSAGKAGNAQVNNEALVQACVNQVLKVLKKKNRR